MGEKTAEIPVVLSAHKASRRFWEAENLTTDLSQPHTQPETMPSRVLLHPNLIPPTQMSSAIAFIPKRRRKNTIPDI
jgi:hypothetical protein